MDGALRYIDRLCLPDVDDLRGKNLEEAYGSQYFIHPGETKMYCVLRDIYLCDCLKKDIAEFVYKCSNCQKAKDVHQNPSN